MKDRLSDKTRRYLIQGALASVLGRGSTTSAQSLPRDAIAPGGGILPEVQWHIINGKRPGHVILPAKLGSRDIVALVDSGATRTVIDDKLATQLGYHIVGESTTTTFTTKTKSVIVRIPSITIGQYVFRDIEAAAIDFSDFTKVVGEDVGLVVGLDILSRLLFELDFLNNRFRILDGIPSYSKLWPNTSLQRDPSGLLAIQIGLDKLMTQAVIDLGSSVPCSVSADYADLHRLLNGKPQSTTLTVGAEGVAESRIISLRLAIAGDFNPFSVPAVIIDDWLLASPVNLGATLFYACDLVFDPSGQRLYVEQNSSRTNEPFPRDRSGIGASRLPDRIVVRHVASNSPAEKAGLHVNDTILAVNGTRITNSFPPPSERLGYKVAGTIISLKLEDGRTIDLKLADYF